MGGDPRAPGHIAARIEFFPSDRRTATILVNRASREVTLDHYRVRENNASDPVFDLWTTKDITLPVNILSFWQALGTFAPEVSQRLAQVQGTVIECTAVLDTGTFKRRFQSHVLEVRTEDVGLVADSVSVPSSFEKVDAPTGPVEAAAPREWDMMTGRPLDPEHVVVFIGPDRRRYTVADADERAALIRLLGQGQRPPFLDGPAPGQGGR
jgi:hypothetical protein